MKTSKLSIAVLALMGGTTASVHALELYVDTKTQQVFTAPGKGRVKLGDFERVGDTANKTSPTEVRELESSLDKKKAELEAIEARLDKKKESIKAVEKKIDTAAAAAPESTEKKWYDKISLRGYSQFRYTQLLHGDDETDRVRLQTPLDRSVGQNTDFLIRRMRLILSGDISDHLYIYLQPEFAALVSGVSSSDSTSQGHYAQLRDAYADVFFDRNREYRVRVGQSKVPFGWETLQSSQNRPSFERTDAIDSTAVRDERDLGVFAYWSPEVAQQRFKYLQKSGLRGSGDYGVIGFGVYNGQGANRFELNDQMHLVARATWPFELPMGQFLEVGASGFSGRYKVSTTDDDGRLAAAPTNLCPNRGCTDNRYGLHAILYPRPFGLQAEWAWGQTPALSKDLTTIESQSLDGGYVQAMYKIDHFYGSWMPYVKWETYHGGSKFDKNSPDMDVQQVEGGLEWQPRPEIELTAAYAHMDRTNVARAPYYKATGDILRLQFQYNY